jgi:hypothetical protein
MNRPHFDWYLVIPFLVLMIFSLTILSSVAPQLLHDQVISVIVCLFVFLFFSAVDYELFFSLHWVSYISLLSLSLMTDFFGIISRGAQR